MKTVKCPECGNSESFYLGFEYVRFEVIYCDGKYLGKLDGDDNPILWCTNCGAQLDFDDANYVSEVAILSI